MAISTSDNILDVAEGLIAQKGYGSVSIRDITRAANVRVGSVNYYFKGKENLYHEIFTRRLEPISKARVELLNSVDFSDLSREKAIEKIVECIIEPVFSKYLSGDSGWIAFFKILTVHMTGVNPSDRDPRHHAAANKCTRRFVEVLSSCSDYKGTKRGYHAYSFIISSTLIILTNSHIMEGLSDGEHKADDYESIQKYAMEFIPAGVFQMLSR